MDINAFGDVLSSNLTPKNYSNVDDIKKKLFEEHTLIIGQVEAIYAVDDPKNEFKTHTLYDVRLFEKKGSSLAQKCRMLQPSFGGGINNFFEVLQQSSGQKAKDFSVSSHLKPGSYVLVGFINGIRAQGVILGGLSHPNSTAVARRPKKGKEPCMEGEFNGFNFSIDKDGAFKVIFNGPRDEKGNIKNKTIGPSTLEINKNGGFSFKTNKNQEFSIDRDKKTVTIVNGTVKWELDQDKKKVSAECDTFEVKANKEVNVISKGKAVIKATADVIISAAAMIKLQKGDGTANEPFILGDKFVQFMKKFLKAVAKHKHIGNLGAPTMTPDNMAEFQSLSQDPIESKAILSKTIVGMK